MKGVWKAAAVLACTTCVAAGAPQPEGLAPKAVRLEVLEDRDGSIVSMRIVNSYPTSGTSVEVSLDLKEEPLEVTAPQDWQYSVSEESECGWNVLWSRDSENEVEEDPEVWIGPFTAKLQSPIGVRPAWCRYSVTFEDGTSAGGFAHAIH